MTGRRLEEPTDERGGPRAGEASLLLSELQHRVANELASAVAAMRLAQNAEVGGTRAALFDRALERLEGFGQVHTVLSSRPARTLDVGAEMHRLCRGLLAGRGGLDSARVRLSVLTPPIPGGPARRLLLVASELIHNSVRHALTDRAGTMDVIVCSGDRHVVLTVSDDGPGITAGAATSGTGLGSGIVAELVRRGEGRIECETDRRGTTFHVTLPLDGPSSIDWLLPEEEW